MSFDLRLPNITGSNDREQLSQIKSYLYQLTSQLQWALNTIDTSSTSKSVVVQTQQNKVTTPQQQADAEVSFAALKPLIIKSAEIVEAYYEEINSRLQSLYVATSDFGTFKEATKQDITQTSTDIKQVFTNVQEIDTAIENLNFTLAEVNAHIKSGLLYEDNGKPVYGLEVGQKTEIDGNEVFKKFARFTSDRLSFYDQNDTEVAYVGDHKLFIRNVQVTSSYKIGGYVDTVTANGGVVTKWVGGDE